MKKVSQTNHFVHVSMNYYFMLQHVQLQKCVIGNYRHLCTFTMSNILQKPLIHVIEMILVNIRDRRDRMVVGFTTTCAISAYHWVRIPCMEEVYSIQHYVINFCQWFATGRWFSLGTLVSSNNKANRHDITEILLKVVLNTINQTLVSPN
jgi:hypothetical protein